MALKSKISVNAIATGKPRRRVVWFLVVAILWLSAACSELQRPKVEPFFAITAPPPRQELRWSNGKLPKSLDPARAAAAPETDIVRAIYDGLTDLDSKSLLAVPAVAERWEATADGQTWTFHLRKDARWSNGQPVTAEDFVRSWKRLAALREKGANRFLFQNIVGMQDKTELQGEPIDFLHSQPPDGGPAATPSNPETQVAPETQNSGSTSTSFPKQAGPTPDTTAGKTSAARIQKFGAQAVNDTTLTVTLDLPDKDFPKLVAHPIFRPVFGDGSNFEKDRLDVATLTNGAFRVVKIADDGISIEPSEQHWNRKSLALESVRFVTAASAENALDAYKKGEVDVVTNAAFEPLALKLLGPFEDFRRTAHSALNFYEVNTARAPFSDRRVREALAISIDRVKLTEGDLEGIMQPANAFFPLGERKSELLAVDTEKAKRLLEKAGYPGGNGFPPIRLVINRNDIQQRVARAIARMWQQNLNLETIVIVKEPSEIEAVRLSGDFDLMRRGVVLPANDEIVNLASIFGSARKTNDASPIDAIPGGVTEQTQKPTQRGPNDIDPFLDVGDAPVFKPVELAVTLTEEDAMFELRAIPLYFPMSHALVKPYVRGFEMNGLDAPSLKEMSIDSSWQPRIARGEQ